MRVHARSVNSLTGPSKLPSVDRGTRKADDSYRHHSACAKQLGLNDCHGAEEGWYSSVLRGLTEAAQGDHPRLVPHTEEG